MNTIELRANFHKLIDTYKNNGVLSKFYDLLLKANQSKENLLWSRLTFEEQEELKRIEQQCNIAENLIPHDEVANKHKKWL
jgi:hypothetical protein